ncbi:hypothetical protein Bca101_059295 [Brassica carinata]
MKSQKFVAIRVTYLPSGINLTDMPSIDNPLPFRPIIPNFVNVYNSFDFVFIKGVQNFGDTGRFVIEGYLYPHWFLTNSKHP